MKIIKLISQILYVIIIFYILIFGVTGISSLLMSIGISGLFNGLFTFIIVIYGLGMFYYDINTVYTNKEKE